MTHAPPDGWYDEFNGLRIPASGSASSFEDLLNLVMSEKKKLGIDLMNQSLEATQLTKRLCRRYPSICSDTSGPNHKKTGCCN